jgi:hypothetical protein
MLNSLQYQIFIRLLFQKIQHNRQGLDGIGREKDQLDRKMGIGLVQRVINYIRIFGTNPVKPRTGVGLIHIKTNGSITRKPMNGFRIQNIKITRMYRSRSSHRKSNLLNLLRIRHLKYLQRTHRNI